MIKYFETFDGIVIKNGSADPLTSLRWTLPGGEGRAAYLACLPGIGRNGSRAIAGRVLELTPFSPPTIQRKCNRIVVGFAIRGPGDADNYAPVPGIGYPTIAPWHVPGLDNLCPKITVKFCYDAFVNFTATIQMSPGGVTIYGKTGSGGYAVIPTMPYRPAPLLGFDYTFYELLVDVTDYINGIFKVAVNGVTVEEQTPVITCDHLGFGSNPFDDRAKLNRVEIAISHHGNYKTTYAFLDTLYLCDDDGGYQNDFLGPLFSKTLYPKYDGDKANWTPYINSTVIEDAPRYQILDDTPFDPANEADYLEADQDLVEELMSFVVDDIPDECIPVSVNHRTATRGVATPGSPLPNALVPLYQATGNPLIPTNSLMKKIDGWDYRFLDVYYNIVPGFAIPWTSLLIGESQFGFMLHEPTWNVVQYDGQDIADEITEEHVPEVTDALFSLVDDISVSAIDIASWDLVVEDGIKGEDNPTDWFYPGIEDELGIADTISGTAEGLRNILTGGTAAAMTTNSPSQTPELAFNGNTGDGWHSAWTYGTPNWLAYQLEDTFHAVVPVGYWLYFAGYYDPTGWQFQVGKGTGEWITIDTQYGSFTPGWHWFPLVGWTPEPVDKFRLNFQAFYYYVYIAELKVMALMVEALEE